MDSLVDGIFTLLAAGVGVFSGGWLALRSYFRQKEYELVKERYLEGAIDILASEVELALEISSHNWARCLEVLKIFRDEKELFDQRELTQGFLEYNISFHRIAHHRVGELVGSSHVWTIYQRALAFVTTKNSIMTKEIPELIRLKLSNQMQMAEIGEIVDKTHKKLCEINDESHRFAYLTSFFHGLGRILERERLTFDHIDRFKERAEVKELVKGLIREFESKATAGHTDRAPENESPITKTNT
jgi:hypothetical protein